MSFRGRLGAKAPIRRKGGISAERAAMSVTAWPAVAVFAAVHVLIATEWAHRVAAAPGGVLGMAGRRHHRAAQRAGEDSGPPAARRARGAVSRRGELRRHFVLV
ncbi:hypothetical protein GCM10010297_58760 [Streptomyces malachitofuscus]|nr:hypothetical protein GCM10010297_58760 [Streptomyces malachitofuscus]